MFPSGLFRTYLEQCKYVVEEEIIEKFIIDALEISSDKSDKEISDRFKYRLLKLLHKGYI